MKARHKKAINRLKREKRGGFTLIATILILSLLTVLVVSSLIISQVEEQAQYNASRSEIARQNALFGLNQALNQLQTAAGPDRRVTARADILSSVPTVSSISPTSYGYSANQPATDAGQSFWTGVWKNTLNDYSGCAGNGLSANPDPAYGATPGPGGDFFYYDYLPGGVSNPGSSTIPNRAQLYNNSNVSWLISWPNSSIPDPTETLSAQGITQKIAIANNLNITTSANPNLASSGNTSIMVPMVPLKAVLPGKTSSATVGYFGFWISDEGIKAKADCPDPYLTQSATNASGYLESQPHVEISQSSAANQALAMNPGIFAASTAVDVRTHSILAPTLASMAYADSSNSPSTWLDFQNNTGHYSSDFTVSTYGVLADNFNGGLKKDLTAAFENQNIYWNQFSDLSPGDASRKMYGLDALSGSGTSLIGNANSSPFIFDGLRWDSLYLYYNLYKSQMPSPISAWQGSNLGPKGVGSNYANGISGCSPAVPTVDARVYCEPLGSGYFCLDPVFPHLVCMTWNVSVGMKQLTAPIPPSTPGTYDLILCGSPKMVTYNPWNVNLLPQVMGNKNNSSIEYDNDPYGTMNLSTIFQVGTSGGTLTGSPVTVNNGGAITYTDQMSDAAMIPGELRVYGMASNLDEGPIPNTSKTTVNINPNGNQLVSRNYAEGNYLYQEITLSTPLQTANPSSDELYFSGGNAGTFLFPNVYVNVLNTSGWPYQPLGTSSSIPMGQPGPLTNIFPTSITPIDSVQNLVNDTLNPATSFTPKLIAQFIDRVPGIGGTGNIAMPNFACGSWYNPLNIDANRGSRDYTGSGTIASLPSSISDIQSVSNGTFQDTGWQPGSVGRSTQNTQVCLREMPRQPLISLGQFKNMNCHYYYYNPSGSWPGIQLQLFSFYPIGGSYQASFPPNDTYGQFAWNSWSDIPVFDDNFLGNEVLFDSYFLSTVPPSNFNTGDSANWSISGFNQDYIDQNKPLPNCRLVYYTRTQSNAGSYLGNPPSTGTTCPNLADLQCPNVGSANLRKPAANLLINGGFNINSTSVAAWEALLASTGGANSINAFQYSPSTLPSLPTLGGVPVSLSTTQTPFMNFASPLSFSGSPNPNTPWFGLVTLKNTSLTTLAKNIVQQIQARGPFLSIGDFLNHRLDSVNSVLATSGALQAAIDGSGINGNVTSAAQGVAPTGVSNIRSNWSVNFGAPSSESGIQFPAQAPAGTLSTANGIPGTLMQNDLVQMIAPAIVDRSDTFIVRAYGEAVNSSTGATEGQAWCEATVQRVPEYLYSAENGVTAPNGNCAYDDPSPSVQNLSSTGIRGLSAVNSAFGRRFKIISIRWLNKNEI